jgi:predicted DNA-binding protein YlxM (UPF0122 family)
MINTNEDYKYKDLTDKQYMKRYLSKSKRAKTNYNEYPELSTDKINQFINDRILIKSYPDGRPVNRDSRLTIINELFKEHGELDKYLRAMSDYQSSVSDDSLRKSAKYSRRASQEKIYSKLYDCAEYLEHTADKRGKKAFVLSKRTEQRRKESEDVYDALLIDTSIQYDSMGHNYYSDYDKLEEDDELKHSLDERTYKINKLKAMNYSQREIADKLGISRSKVRTTLEKTQKGLEHHKPSLTEIEDLKKIIKRNSKIPKAKTQLEKYRELNKKQPVIVHKPNGES